MSLADIRHRIDVLDQEILNLLAQRMEQSRLVAACKADGKIEDRSREKQLREVWGKKARQLELPEELALEILDVILVESKRVQQKNV